MGVPGVEREGSRVLGERRGCVFWAHLCPRYVQLIVGRDSLDGVNYVCGMCLCTLHPTAVLP